MTHRRLGDAAGLGGAGHDQRVARQAPQPAHTDGRRGSRPRRVGQPLGLVGSAC